MEELTIRRNRSFAAPQRQSVTSAQKPSGAAAAQTVRRSTGLSVSETLRQLMDRVGQAADRSRESRRTLQMGEGVLAEVQDRLARMADLAEKAAGEDGVDRNALQAGLEQLIKEIDRMTGSALAGDIPLFLDADAAGAEALLRALAGSAASGQSAALPDWLAKAVVQGALDADRILASLGLDKTASGADVLAALAGRLPESDPAAGYLAALYLGAVIAKGSGDLDPTAALDGLRQLLETTAAGIPLDEAVRLLTSGEYTSLADFQEQFAGGTVPGLQAFLTGLLLSDSGTVLPEGASLLTLMAGSGGMELDLLLALMSAGETRAAQPEPAQSGPEGAAVPGADAAPEPVSAGAVPSGGAPQPMEVLRFGDIQVIGRDLSAVSYDPDAGLLTIGGTADAAVQGTGTDGQTAIRVTGSGTVTVQDVRASLLTADAAEARVVTVGVNLLGEVRLGENTVLTLDGRGFLHAGAFSGGERAVLHLTGGAVALAENADGTPGTIPVPVVLDGPVSLAAQAARVRDGNGRTLEPFDVVWKTLLPGFGAVTALAADGRHVRMALMGGEHPDALRLWLAKGDLSAHGYPAHTLTVQGRDEAGRARTRYAYLRWARRAGAFQELSMYPNPFTVTGGEQDRDWYYEEETHTLHILSGQVTAVSGGAGMDIRQEPFSGRIALSDRIGGLKLALGGVVCRVSSGQAFQLGRENSVTLILRSGTTNLFESGAGCAGISMGEGTSLRVDCAAPRDGENAGTLTATGGAGGVGIGRDSGVSRDRSGHIMIRGGTAIGGDKPGGVGSVTIVGSSGGADSGGARTWARMGIFLQMGEDTVILPQFPLSSRTLQLNKLRVSTREYANAARITIDADRRWVSQLQTAYHTLSSQVEQSVSGLDSARRYLLRDSTAASVLLRDVSQSVPVLSSRAREIHAGQGAEDVGQLFR